MADRSPARELGQDPGFEHSEREDSLEDSASHIPAAPHLREVPPPTTVVPMTAPAPYSDPVFIAQIVRAIIETMPQLCPNLLYLMNCQSKKTTNLSHIRRPLPFQHCFNLSRIYQYSLSRYNMS
jgi:hypothetical protein